MDDFACFECQATAMFYCSEEKRKYCQDHIEPHYIHIEQLSSIETFNFTCPGMNQPKKDLKDIIQNKPSIPSQPRPAENKNSAFPIISPNTVPAPLKSQPTVIIKPEKANPSNPAAYFYPNYQGYSNCIPQNKASPNNQPVYYPNPGQQNAPISYLPKPEIIPISQVCKPEPPLPSQSPKVIEPKPSQLEEKKGENDLIQLQLNELKKQFEEVKLDLKNQKNENAELEKQIKAEKEKGAKLEQEKKARVEENKNIPRNGQVNPNIPRNAQANPNIACIAANPIPNEPGQHNDEVEEPGLEVDLYKVSDFCHRCFHASLWYCLEDAVALCNTHVYEHQGHSNAVERLPDKQHLPVNKLEKEARRVKHQIQDVLKGLFNN